MVKALIKSAPMVVANAQVVVVAGYFFMIVTPLYFLKMVLCTLGCLLIV